MSGKLLFVLKDNNFLQKKLLCPNKHVSFYQLLRTSKKINHPISRNTTQEISNQKCASLHNDLSVRQYKIRNKLKKMDKNSSSFLYRMSSYMSTPLNTTARQSEYERLLRPLQSVSRIDQSFLLNRVVPNITVYHNKCLKISDKENRKKNDHIPTKLSMLDLPNAIHEYKKENHESFPTVTRKHSRMISTAPRMRECFPSIPIRQSVNQVGTIRLPIVPLQTRQCSTQVRKPQKDTDSPVTDTQSTNPKTEITHVYKNPKNILHNCYATVAKELNNKDLELRPAYHPVVLRPTSGKGFNSDWSCVYSLKWPEVTNFTGTAATKRDASLKAAQTALAWLKKNGRITTSGQPIIVNQNEANQFVKSMTRKIVLHPQAIDQMENIVKLYNNNFVPNLVDDLSAEAKVHTGTLVDFEQNEVRKINQTILQSDRYLAKEKVVLPIAAYKQEFIDLLRQNSVVILKGEPGCGKSTRIPQYVLESWITDPNLEGTPCKIAVTQPRRIAAISLAERVSKERDEPTGEIIGYQVRFKSNFDHRSGRVLYCTTGILLRLLQSDPHLSTFTHVILDEAHERDVNTDLLMNLLKTTMHLNPKLKLVVMSATIDTGMFQDYFNGAPVMHIPGFAHPVKQNFLEELRHIGVGNTLKLCDNESPHVVPEEIARVIKYIHQNKSEGAILCFLPGWEDISSVRKLLLVSQDMIVLCLHSRLHDSDQWKIFSRPPPGIRKVILSTNIAETSVTIDDVVYVVDSGIHKEHRFDNEKGINCIDNFWISQASSIQRKGRAGRVRPGESFHMYSKAKYDSLPKYSDPEILKTSLTKIVLDSKVYSNNMKALEFMSQLPTPPTKVAGRTAVRELKDLELLDDEENLTPLGRTLANFQLEPKLAKVMVNSVVYKCVTPIVDIITLFSADTEVFGSSLMDKEGIKRIKAQVSRNSDHLALMRLFEKWLELMETGDDYKAQRYCAQANLIHQKLITIHKLRQVHFDYLYKGLRSSLPIADNYSDNDELVKAILLSGVGTVLQHRNFDFAKGRYKKSNVFLTNYNHKATISSESVNFKKVTFASDLLVYINEIRSNIRRTSIIRETSEMSCLAILLFSNKNIFINEDETTSDMVRIGLEGTKVEFSCSKSGAESIKECKEVLNMAYKYFVFQITQGGESNEDLNRVWDRMLDLINKLLINHCV